MKVKIFSRLCFSILFLFLGACTTKKEPLLSANANQLLEHTWKLIEITDPNGHPVFSPDTTWSYTVRFLTNGNIEAQNACNDCGGTYQIEPGNKLSIALSCTEVLCEPSADFLEYGNDLNHAREFKLVNDQLWIMYEEGTVGLFYLVHKSM